MSGFLNNLVAKGRGSLSRLEPRRPAPYEGAPDGLDPNSLEPRPQTADALTSPSVPKAAAPSSPTVPAAATALPEPAVEIPAAPQKAMSVDTTLTLNTLPPKLAATAPSAAPPTVVPSATPVAAPNVARRMADAVPSAPPPLAPASLPSTQTQVPRPPAKAAPALIGAIERAVPAQPPEAGILPNVETLLPVIDAPQTTPPPATKTQERSLPTSSERPEPTPLPLLQVEVQIPRPVAQAQAKNPGEAAPTTEAPVVEVHIGTIEVVAAQPQPPMAQQRVAAQPRGISLDDFLDGTGRR